MHHQQHQLLCPVPEEMCGCREVVCWSVVPEEPPGCQLAWGQTDGVLGVRLAWMQGHLQQQPSAQRPSPCWGSLRGA